MRSHYIDEPGSDWDWHEHFVFFHPVVTVDGRRVTWDRVMRRSINGRWEYRDRTDKECAEDQAW